MDGQFQDVLNGLPDKALRSRLEPYSALIDELRRRGRTFPEITQILGDRCHVKTAASAIHDFVRVRSRREHRTPKGPSTGTSRSLSPPTLQAVETATPTANPSSAVDEVRRRIAALKVRKPVIELTPEGFRFDPSEPLRLKKPGKK